MKINYKYYTITLCYFIYNREDVEGKSPNVSRTDENTSASLIIDPTIDDRSLLYQETW